MKQIKHTLGPWKVIEVKGDKHTLVYRRITNEKYGSLGFAGVYKDNEECKANARLISVAPELLEACKEAGNTLLSVQKEHSHDAYTVHIKEALSLIDTTIAKAEGKEN